MKENWEARNDMRTLIEAEEIKADPKRLKAAKAEAKREMQKAKKVEKLAKS